jgi:DNA polymerase-3 subunit gamma/tau
MSSPEPAATVEATPDMPARASRVPIAAAAELPRQDEIVPPWQADAADSPPVPPPRKAPAAPRSMDIATVETQAPDVLPAQLQPVAPQMAAIAEEADEGDDEPPAGEDYYEIDPDAFAYLAKNDEPQGTVEHETEADVSPATGLAAEWLELFPRLGLSGMTGAIASNCTLVAASDDSWTLHLDPAHSALFNASQQRRLADALGQHLGRSLKVEVKIEKPSQETPALAAARRRLARQREAEVAIQADPLVQQMMQQFAAVIRDGSIEPIES